MLVAKLRKRGPVLPPCDQTQVIAGQGTAALELFEEVGHLTGFLFPVAAVDSCPAPRWSRTPSHHRAAWWASPAAADDATRSFRARRLRTVHHPKTVADGARTSSLGSLTFPLLLQDIGGMTTVDDSRLLNTMFILWERLKLAVEPTGALGAATVRRAVPADPARFGTRVGVLSGGTVDCSQVPSWLQYR